MDYREALDKTIKNCDLNASELSRRSGVGTNQISNYRKGKSDLYSENLQAIIDALPSDAQMHFYGLLLQSGKTCHGVAPLKNEQNPLYS